VLGFLLSKSLNALTSGLVKTKPLYRDYAILDRLRTSKNSSVQHLLVQSSTFRDSLSYRSKLEDRRPWTRPQGYKGWQCRFRNASPPTTTTSTTYNNFFKLYQPHQTHLQSHITFPPLLALHQDIKSTRPPLPSLSV
jgi:hypothetical protein